MSGLLRNWLADAVAEEFEGALNWSKERALNELRASQNPPDEDAQSVPNNDAHLYEDDGSNLRIKLAHVQNEQRVVQILEFISNTRPVQAIVSDGFTTMFASFSPKAVEECANQINRGFTKGTLGGVGNLKKYTIIATTLGPSAHGQRLKLNIEEFLYIGAAGSPQFGHPKALITYPGIQALMERLKAHHKGEIKVEEPSEEDEQAEIAVREAVSRMKALGARNSQSSQRQRQTFDRILSSQMGNSQQHATQSPSYVATQAPMRTQWSPSPDPSLEEYEQSPKGVNVAPPTQGSMSQGTMQNTPDLFPPTQVPRRDMTPPHRSRARRQQPTESQNQANLIALLGDIGQTRPTPPDPPATHVTSIRKTQPIILDPQTGRIDTTAPPSTPLRTPGSTRISTLSANTPASIHLTSNRDDTAVESPVQRPSVHTSNSSGRLSNTRHVPCRLFQKGRCNAGTDCRFAHTMEKRPCPSFLKGRCKYGFRCAFKHENQCLSSSNLTSPRADGNTDSVEEWVQEPVVVDATDERAATLPSDEEGRETSEDQDVVPEDVDEVQQGSASQNSSAFETWPDGPVDNFDITKEQRRVLRREESRRPPEPGRRFPHPNIPVEHIIDLFGDDAMEMGVPEDDPMSEFEQNEETHTDDSESEAPSDSEDEIPWEATPSQKQRQVLLPLDDDHAALGDDSGDISVDSDDEVAPSPSVHRTSGLPPDSSALSPSTPQHKSQSSLSDRSPEDPSPKNPVSPAFGTSTSSSRPNEDVKMAEALDPTPIIEGHSSTGVQGSSMHTPHSIINGQRDSPAQPVQPTGTQQSTDSDLEVSIPCALGQQTQVHNIDSQVMSSPAQTSLAATPARSIGARIQVAETPSQPVKAADNRTSLTKKAEFNSSSQPDEPRQNGDMVSSIPVLPSTYDPTLRQGAHRSRHPTGDNREFTSDDVDALAERQILRESQTAAELAISSSPQVLTPTAHRDENIGTLSGPCTSSVGHSSPKDESSIWIPFPETTANASASALPSTNQVQQPQQHPSPPSQRSVSKAQSPVEPNPLQRIQQHLQNPAEKRSTKRNRDATANSPEKTNKRPKVSEPARSLQPWGESFSQDMQFSQAEADVVRQERSKFVKAQMRAARRRIPGIARGDESIGSADEDKEDATEPVLTTDVETDPPALLYAWVTGQTHEQRVAKILENVTIPSKRRRESLPVPEPPKSMATQQLTAPEENVSAPSQTETSSNTKTKRARMSTPSAMHAPAASLPEDVSVMASTYSCRASSALTPQEPQGIGVEGAPTDSKALDEGCNLSGRGVSTDTPARPGVQAQPSSTSSARISVGSDEHAAHPWKTSLTMNPAQSPKPAEPPPNPGPAPPAPVQQPSKPVNPPERTKRKPPGPPLPGPSAAANRIFNQFRQAYPEYTGNMSHFRGICQQIDEYNRAGTMQHKSLWDDFIVRYKTMYEPWAYDRLVNGLLMIGYEKYYRDEIDEPRYKMKIMNPDTLKVFLHDMSMGPVQVVPAEVRQYSAQTASHQANRQIAGLFKDAGNTSDSDRASLDANKGNGAYSGAKDTDGVPNKHTKLIEDMKSERRPKKKEQPVQQFVNEYTGLKGVQGRLGDAVEDALEVVEKKVDVLDWDI